MHDINHMRILGIEPSLVTLSQTKQFQKLKSVFPKVFKQAKAIRNGVISPQNYNFNPFQQGYFYALKTLRNNR